MSAGTRWIQFENCIIQAILNTEDTPCACTLNAFAFDSNNSDALPVSDIRSINGQMCDMICDNNKLSLVSFQIITTDFDTFCDNTAAGFLSLTLKPPELL